MIGREAFVIAVYSAQGILALVLAALFFLFLHDFHRPYLRHWGLAFLAMAVHVGLAAAAFLLIDVPGRFLARTLFSAGSLSAVYVQVTLLLCGVLALARGGSIPERRVVLAVLLAIVAGTLTAAVGALDADAVSLRIVTRLGIKHLLLAMAFALAGWVILRQMTGRARSGAWFLAVSLFAYSVDLLLKLVLHLGAAFRGWDAGWMAGVMLGDLVFYAVIGAGLITWLFQQERHEAAVARSEASRLSQFDALTQLPNRSSIRARMTEQLRILGDTDLRAVYALVDLERFRRINDSLGHRNGDRLLQIVAGRLRESVGSGCMVARLGSDEFAFLIPDVRDDTEARTRLGYLMDAIREPLRVGGRDIHLDCFCGYALFPDDGDSASSVSRAAELAHSTARRQSTRQPLRFSSGMEEAADEFLAMESDLRRAIPEGQLRLLYQPIVDADRRLRGVEALVRWQHPERGLLSPDAFLPLAGTAGLASAIDYWVLETACSQAVAWREAGLDLQIGVNLSANLFEASRLPANVDRLLRRVGMAPEQLELEITEQVAMKDVEAGNAVIERLRRVGVKLALDDFGTGYSSMSWLRRLPVDRIKIDRSFTRELDSKVGHAIVRSMVELAHAMELEVTAEGVESMAQFEHLRKLRCDLYQGFLFSRPMEADAIPAFGQPVLSG